ncbi:MAG: hypothetical protein ACREJ3_11770 [Polyangiaceae bacterium]
MNRSEHLRDEDLADALTRAQEAHVDHCTECANRRSTTLAVQEAVRALPRAAEPPASALALLEHPGSARPWRRRTRRIVLGALAAAALAASVLVALRLQHHAPMSPALAEEIALDHLHYENKTQAAEVSGSTEQIDAYFTRTLQRDPRLAPLEATTLLGGKRCRIGGQWSALVWLERAGHWLSLFSMPQDAVARRGCVREAGVNVCGIRDPNGGARVLAGNLPNAEMLRLLDESMQ